MSLQRSLDYNYTINYSIDSKINDNDYFLANDYNSKIVYSCICDCMFIYSKLKKIYIPNACESYNVSNKYKKYELLLRDDLYYSNGEKIKASDYKLSIQRLIGTNGILAKYFENIKELKTNDRRLIIELSKPDRNFITKLSIYQICPGSNNRSSGEFIIKKKSSNIVELIPNEFHRSKKNYNINFNVLKNSQSNLKEFNNNRIDCTANTVFTLKNEILMSNVKVEKSHIIHSIEISSKIPKKLRSSIANTIDRKNIVSIIGQNCDAKSDFNFIDSNIISRKNIQKLNTSKQELTLGYNNYFPNEMIANQIKLDLEKKGFKIKLLKYEYNIMKYEVCKKVDINLVLNFFEYYDDLYFYESKYFTHVMKNNIMYNYALNKYKKNGNKFILKLINYMFKRKNIKIPLMTIDSIYYVNHLTENISFLENNF